MSKILFLTYYASLPGACQAEYADDRIEALTSSGYEIILLSSVSSFFNKTVIHHCRVSSISREDSRQEDRCCKSHGIEYVTSFMMRSIAVTLGYLCDLMQKLLVGGVGEGRWGWLPSSLMAGIYLAKKYSPDLIIASGGPASALLSGVLIGKVARIPVTLEYQDPLSGGGVGRNIRSSGWLIRVERLINSQATKAIYTNKLASILAKNNSPNARIGYYYPGAKDFKCYAQENQNFKKPLGVIRFVHLGTLYATRNFDSIIIAIDELIDEGLLDKDRVKLINLGHVDANLAQKLLAKSYIELMDVKGRYDAVKFASNCDVRVLIQNDDRRSEVTVPYKTYDYLNIKGAILALVRSDELRGLLNKHGHPSAWVSDVPSIKKLISAAINESTPGNQFSTIDSHKEIVSLLS